MRILMLHNRYLVAGGEEAAVADDAALLQEHGHQVELLEKDNREIKRIGKAGAALSTLWSRDSYERVKEILQAGHFDILHVHNFFPLWSPSVYYAASRAGVPVVQTLHNYRLMCVNSFLFRNGKVCEECVHRWLPWPGVVHGCYRESRTGSAVISGMIGLHKLLNTWQSKVQVYIAVSEFAREKYIAGGFPAEKIMVKPNFVSPSPLPGSGGGGFALYVGRLSPEKGIANMLKAWETADRCIPLKVVGDGPLATQVEAAAATTNSIQYLGRKSSGEVLELMRQAEFLVFPSEWYETMGRTVLEALAVGTPVLTSALGERASLIVPGRNGFHFPAGDVNALRERVEWCSQNLPQVRSLRKAARLVFEQKFTGPQNVALLLNIYHQAQQRYQEASNGNTNRRWYKTK